MFLFIFLINVRGVVSGMVMQTGGMQQSGLRGESNWGMRFGAQFSAIR